MRFVLAAAAAVGLLILSAEANGTTECLGIATRPPPTPAERAFAEKTRAFFEWMRFFSRSVIWICEYRVRPRENAWLIGRKLGIPLWALERVNRGSDLARLRVRTALRVPAARGDIVRRCFTPLRAWRDQPESRAPFWW